MPNSIPITSAQSDASRRNDLRGTVYALSGTLPGRGGRPDQVFRWATRTFSGAIGDFELYLGPPQSIRRAQPFALGENPETPPVKIPIRNLPFAEERSLVAAISDDAYAWENAAATLRVGYLKPGQEAADLAEEDWTPLVLDGFLGTPIDIDSDGFNLMLYARGARRNQALRQPLVSPENGDFASNIERADLNRPWPIWFGHHDGYVPLPTLDVGERGFIQARLSSGATSLVFRTITVSGGSGIEAGSEVLVHYTSPSYVVSGVSRDGELVTVTLSSGLAAEVPRGGLVQQVRTQYVWAAAAHELRSATGIIGAGGLAWILPDGRVVPHDPGTWQFRSNDRNVHTVKDGYPTLDTVDLNYDSGAGIPAFYDPQSNDPVEVTQQPTFDTTSEQQLSDKTNFPSGGSGTDNDLARDGNEDTGASLPAGNSITLTFNSAPSPFADDDTTGSVLYVVAQGEINFFAGASATSLGSIGPGANKGQYRFVQVSGFNFDQSVRCSAPSAGGGGVVYEVWWEHDLSTEIVIDRADDVLVGGGGANPNTGPVMEHARLALRIANNAGNELLANVRDITGALVPNPWREIDTFGGGQNTVSYPSTVMASLQSMLLGPEEGGLHTLDSGVYDTAHARFVASGIRLMGTLTEPLRSWTDLENQMALQSRAYFYYGPGGHQILFAEDEETLESAAVQQVFRLPGVPGANALQSQGPLVERTSVSDVVNEAVVRWGPDYPGDRDLKFVASGVEAESLSLVGRRRAIGGDYDFPHVAPLVFHPTFSAADMVSGHAVFLARRFAFPKMRFAFDTAWIAHGLDRGSLVRVVYDAGQGAFRAATCEVEEIAVSPIRSERFRLVCRAVTTPQKGFGAETWRELFVDADDDRWVTRIESEFDLWKTYWVVPS